MQEKARGKAGKIAEGLIRLDLVVLDEAGCRPFGASGGESLFHLPEPGSASEPARSSPPVSASANVPLVDLITPDESASVFTAARYEPE